MTWFGAVAVAVTPWFPTGAVTEPALPTVLPARGFAARERDESLVLPQADAARLRRDALSRAIAWQQPAEQAELARLREQPDDFFRQADELVCKFRPAETSGSTPKFECVFEGGEVLKVKYGGSPEIHSEVAATRLMRALGAGADRMYLVGRLRCFGCPADPYAMLSCISSPLAERRRDCEPMHGVKKVSGKVQVDVDYRRYVDFKNVAIERKLEGRAIKADGVSGWGWDELAELAEGHQGPRLKAERDALRLLAVFLNHWDNRPDNQRLVCLDDGARLADGGCYAPLAYMQDVGATFGYVGGEKSERKLDVEGWQAAPIWRDAARCVVSIRSPRLHGATFEDATISEAGRLFLAERFARLRRNQVRDLFEGARFDAYESGSAASRSIDRWVSVFERKVREITERQPCPTP